MFDKLAHTSLLGVITHVCGTQKKIFAHVMKVNGVQTTFVLTDLYCIYEIQRGFSMSHTQVWNNMRVHELTKLQIVGVKFLLKYSIVQKCGVNRSCLLKSA